MEYLDIFRYITTAAIYIDSLGPHRNSFANIELFLIVYSQIDLETKLLSPPVYLSSLFCYLFNSSLHPIQPINTLLLFGLDIQEEIDKSILILQANFGSFTYCLAVTSLCSWAQYFIYLKDKNLQRKIFHFAMFLVFFKRNIAVIYFAQYLMYMFLCFSQTRIPNKVLHAFINEKDYGKGIFSHIYLLGSILYPYFYLNEPEYVRTIISICIMDSCASIVGIYFKKKTKSIIGMIFGQICSYLVEFAVVRTIDFKYHITMGLIEYFCKINDNIILPVASVMYFKLQNYSLSRAIR